MVRVCQRERARLFTVQCRGAAIPVWQPLSFSYLAMGRQRAYTRMAPFMSSKSFLYFLRKADSFFKLSAEMASSLASLAACADRRDWGTRGGGRGKEEERGLEQVYVLRNINGAAHRACPAAQHTYMP